MPGLTPFSAYSDLESMIGSRGGDQKATCRFMVTTAGTSTSNSCSCVVFLCGFVITTTAAIIISGQANIMVHGSIQARSCGLSRPRALCDSMAT